MPALIKTGDQQKGQPRGVAPTDDLLGSEALWMSLIQMYTGPNVYQRKSIRTVGAGPCACPNKNGRSTKRATTGGCPYGPNVLRTICSASQGIVGPLIQIYTDDLLASEALLGPLIQIYTDGLLVSEALLGPLIQIYTDGLLGSEALWMSLIQMYTGPNVYQRKSIRTVGAGPCACPRQPLPALTKTGDQQKGQPRGVALTDDLLVSEALLGPLIQIYTDDLLASEAF